MENPNEVAAPSSVYDNRGRISGKMGRYIARLLLLAVLLIAACSLYVAMREADRQEIVIIGSSLMHSGGPNSLRVVVRDRISQAPISGAEVRLSLNNDNISLGRFVTGADGSFTNGFDLPPMSSGNVTLRVAAASPLGRDQLDVNVTVAAMARLLLTTDKPIYQPGQTIHLRSLALHGRTMKPLNKESLTFLITDPKGNKVYQATMTNSAFGIASADFALASELDTGRYLVAAFIGEDARGACAKAERTVEVKRYALPKFKVSLASDQPYYRPGQMLKGAVRAEYFFGKPVSGAVRVVAESLHETAVIIGEASGVMDNEGRYEFVINLPGTFAGMGLKGGQAFLDLTAEVRDQGGHAEKGVLSLTVTDRDLDLLALPEGGELVAGVENLVYVVTAYPDGRPAKCRVNIAGKSIQTDDTGLGVARLTPPRLPSAASLLIEADDGQGHRARTPLVLTNLTATLLLLRTDKALYAGGELMRITVLTPDRIGTVFVDVTQDRQTVLTRSLEVRQGRGDTAFELPVGLTGLLEVNAYTIAANGDDRGCTRRIHVRPAAALKIQTTWDHTAYRPGEIAKLQLQVTDQAGRSFPTALGVAVVDESVFALAENRPGLLAQFLEARDELLKPRYQIQFFNQPWSRWENPQTSQDYAQAYFASIRHSAGSVSLDDMVKDYVKVNPADYIRAMRGTPEYEALRNNPEWSALIKAIEGENSGAGRDLKQTTGATKAKAVEEYRHRYFSWVKRGAASFGAGVLVMWLLASWFASLRHQALLPMSLAELPLQSATEIRAMLLQYCTLGPLALFPVFYYPLAVLASVLGGLDDTPAGIAIVGTEVFISVSVCTWLYWRLAPLRVTGDSPASCWPTHFYVTQTVVLHAGFATAISTNVEALAIILLLCALIMPAVILACARGVANRILEYYGLQRLRLSAVIAALLAVGTIILLAMVAIPNFVKARTTATKNAMINNLRQLDGAKEQWALEHGQPKSTESGAESGPRLRRHFPETLFWRPQLITDDAGRATLELPLADSITTWRATFEAVNTAGQLGGTNQSLRVFQDFFVDLDLPATLTLGDEISVPVVCYNYLAQPQSLQVTVEPADWFASPVAGRAQPLELGPNAVGSLPTPMKVKRVGTFKLRVLAQGVGIGDAIERDIVVLPSGRRIEQTDNLILRDRLEWRMTLPPGMVADSGSLVAKIYPTRFSEILEGLDAVFAAPHGCFEQTSCTTYPNVLALNYLKRTKRLAPEVEVKARKYINEGYQRLISFEVAGGGFEWFGHAPAHVGLTAYGLLEFQDMAQVHAVDAKIIERTVKWLESQQNSNGAWTGSRRWDALGGLDDITLTAYTAWALAEAGQRTPALTKALQFLQANEPALITPYLKGLAANAALTVEARNAWGQALVEELRRLAKPAGEGMVSWPAQGQSMTRSTGQGLEVETTAVCTLALMKIASAPQTVKEALTWLSAHKSANGLWENTQATVLAMRALIAGTETARLQETDTEIQVALNGRPIKTLKISKANSEVMHLISLTADLQPGENRLDLRQIPAGELACQVSGTHWMPELKPSAETASEPLHIEAVYDRTMLAVNDTLVCTVSVANQSPRSIPMALVDMGIPPGFTVDLSAFEQMQGRGEIARHEVAGTRVRLYLRLLNAAETIKFNYTLKALYPLRVTAPKAVVYEYYTPRNRAESQASRLQVVNAGP